MNVNVQIPEPLSTVMRVCEVCCVAGCCGLDAFDISPELLCEWPQAGKEILFSEALRQVDALLKDVLSENFYRSEYLNYCGTGPEWVEVLSKWKTAIEGAVSSCGSTA